MTERDWTQVRAEYERQRHAVQETDDGYRARNFTQGWTLDFDGRGMRVTPDSEAYTWGLELASYGPAGAAEAVASPKRVTGQVERVAYEWDGGLEEWFLNDRRGLEHGFTLRTAPRDAENAVELNLRVRGDLRARVGDDGLAATFVNGQGRTAVLYAGLKAWDSAGRTLAARLEPSREGLRMVVETAEAVYPVFIDPIAQQAYLKASNTDPFDGFGNALSLSGDTLAVGAFGESSQGTGVNSNTQASNSAVDSGAVYIFQRSGGTWTQQAYIKASNTGGGDNFGYSVSLEGDLLVVGAPFEDSNGTGVNSPAQFNNSTPDSGAAYVFQRAGGVWSQQAYLKASNTGTSDYFGYSVAISGTTIAVGANFEASNGKGVNPNAQGDNSASGAGAVYVFAKTGSVWTQQAYLKASNAEALDMFGSSVSLSGDTLAVGAHFESSAGTGVAANQPASNAAAAAGAVYVFQRTGSSWAQQAYIKASNTDPGDFFGWAVSLAGNTLAVGAPRESSSGTGVNSNSQANDLAGSSGAVYVFQRSGSVWSQQAYVKASNTGVDDAFGSSVAVSADTLVVGATGEAGSGVGIDPPSQSNNSEPTSGAVYVFSLTPGGWAQQSYVKASNTDGGDSFGYSVALSGGTMAAGAYGESSAGTGVNSNTQGDNSSAQSGAVYVFDGLGSGASAAGDKVGVYRTGTWRADRNGNGAFNPGADLDFAFGFPGSTPLTGDWNGDGKISAGLYANGFWFLDHNGDGFYDSGIVDKQYQFGWNGVTPLVGDWNGDGTDTIGIYINGFWFLDADGDGIWDGPGADIQAEFGWNGVTPLTGDWNGNGRDKIGIYINGFWYFDYNGNALWDGPFTDRQAEFGWSGVKPLTGDWNGDGTDTIGIFIDGYWYLDADGDGIWDGPGQDIQSQFGWNAVTLVHGDWNGDGREKIGFFIDGFFYLDYDGSATWDNGVNDKAYVFGQPGDTPFVGPW